MGLSDRTYRRWLTACRILAAGLGVSLMVGETLRSWGQHRHPLYVMDDFFVGLPLVFVAVLMGQPTVVRHCCLTGVFAAATAMLYGSYFSKVVDPLQPQASNFDQGLLTNLVGLALLVALIGLIASLYTASLWNDDGDR